MSARKEKEDVGGVVKRDPFRFDAKKVEELKSASPWLADPKYIKRCSVSTIAGMKMLNHAIEGVERGMNGPNRMPIEIMGLMVGRVDSTTPGGIIVTDVFPLPIQGSETQVVVTDEVQVLMTKIADSLRKTRKEHVIGWYHSHPFDVGVDSNCFFSQTDCNSQMLWQRMEDRLGNPWTGIVVDPLRSLAKNVPVMSAFRCFPDTHSEGDLVGPDGKRYPTESAVTERWGTAYKVYYEIPVDYFVSPLGMKMLNVLSRDFMWTRVLATSPALHKETADGMAKRLAGIADSVERPGGPLRDPFGRTRGDDKEVQSRWGGRQHSA